MAVRETQVAPEPGPGWSIADDSKMVMTIPCVATWCGQLLQ
jgi:hypothetical protein